MPGLKELSQFRDKLSKLGHEREVTAERGEEYEELPLPPDVSASVPLVDVDDLLSGIGQGSNGEEPFSFDTEAPSADPFASDSSADLSGFDDLLDSLPLEDFNTTKDFNDVTFPDLTDETSEKVEEKTTEALPDDSFDDFGVPEDLLSGFATEIEEGRAEDEGFSLPSFELPEITETSESAELPSTDVEELSEIAEPPDNQIEDLPTSEVEELGEIEELPTDEIEELGEIEELPEGESFDDFSIPDLTNADIPVSGEDLPGLDEMDFTPSFEMEDVPKKETTSDFESGSDLDSFSGLDAFADIGKLGDESDIQDTNAEEEPVSSVKNPFGDDFSDFTVPDDLNIVDTDSSSSDATLPSLDGFDGFSLDADFLKTSIDSSASETDEFHIPGFSDFTSGPERPSLSEFPSGVTGEGSAKRGVKKDVPLKISDGEFQQFLEILATFPLNLRIAVEEYLAGEPGTEIHKMELVHSILANTSVRKIARTLETALDRSIPIPKDFEKKTVADYEKEKASLKYVFMNRILPATILFATAAVLAFCVGYLSYQFIYRPFAAEVLYKRGYVAIEDGRYSQSITLFDEAVKEWDKKKWYFRYARAYKEKKQYISAEMMYERILDRFKNDKAAGLEYAEMLRTDLRNFEKAETILKRRLLDYYVNDSDGLMLLGDNYLDWAEEDSSKYEDARRTYATLIELYGTQDPYLARMMRYFIRTDQLVQVLPLKDHFMVKGTKIGAQDLVELSGYLLEKRYNPRAGESEFLLNQIEDVKSLLARAVKADTTIPEAHYNMGRFLIYNYDTELAAAALDEALRQFDTVRTMSPKRVLTYIDTYRLRGELYAENKEYLNAQKQYALGITLYEEQRANQTVLQDSRVGKLYADYADIDYFISGDLDNALVNYTKATRELNDIPSVRYRIGYIEYQKQNYEAAMNVFNLTQAEVPGDKNLLYAFGNTLFRRGDFYAAQGYLERLMAMMDSERLRKGIIFPQIRIDHGVFVQEYMQIANNLGVTLWRLSYRTGDSRKNARALVLLSESTRAWDSLTRNPETMIRAKGSNLAFMNIQNMTHPRPDFLPEIYADIPKTLQNEKVLQQRVDQ